MKKRKLGILGLGSQSTLFYMEELNALYHEKHQGYSTCPFLLLNTNFDEINRLLPHVSAELNALVQNSMNALIELGVDVVLVPNMTLFETLDQLQFKAKVIHPVYCTISEIEKKGFTKAVILGTKYTMKSEYLKSIFAANGIEIIPPTDEEVAFMDALRTQVYQRSETQEDLDEFHQMLEQFSKEHAVVIACTELSVARSKKNDKVFDMARIQIKCALEDTEKV